MFDICSNSISSEKTQPNQLVAGDEASAHDGKTEMVAKSGKMHPELRPRVGIHCGLYKVEESRPENSDGRVVVVFGCFCAFTNKPDLRASEEV